MVDNAIFIGRDCRKCGKLEMLIYIRGKRPIYVDSLSECECTDKPHHKSDTINKAIKWLMNHPELL